MVDNLANVRYVYEDSTDTVTISARSGESHKIKEIYIDSPASDSYVDVKIGTKIVARIPVAMGDGLWVSPYDKGINDRSIVAVIQELFGNDVFFEADEDEDITLSFSATQTGVHVFYEVGKTGIDKTKLGRSASDNYIMFSMATHSADINATGDYELDTAIAPEGFPDIANNFVVPSGRHFDIRAIGFASTANSGTKPTKLHFYDETYEFFDPLNHSGITVDPDHNILYANVKQNQLYRVDSYIIDSGHKITLTMDATYDGTNTVTAGTEKAILVGIWRLK